MNIGRRTFLTFGSAATVSAIIPRKATAADCNADDFWEAVKLLESTKVTDYNQRAEALEVAQKYIYALKDITAYNPYYRLLQGGEFLDAATVAEIHRDAPAMAWYDRAFERVLREVKETTVTGRVPAIWYVYNMGIIVKTATCTFSVDLCHRLAAKAVPLLDFALVSHNHGDHFTNEFFSRMHNADKRIRSNFYLDWGGYCKDASSVFRFKDIRIRCTETDHNPHLPKAVMCFEIFCGEKDPYVIFHSGDSHCESQLQPLTPHPDLYIGHCAIGLSFPNAYRTTMPAKRMVIAHHQELGHLWGRWRCIGFHEEPAHIMKELGELGADVIMPVWGDRLD